MSVAIVGATGAIGSSIARRVLARGGTPWLIGRNADALQSLSQTLNGAPFTVADARQAEQLGDALAPDLPADLKGFAYCAGDIALKPFKRAEPADFRACFELHVVGAAAALRSVEAKIRNDVLPLYANTHTSTSTTGAQSSCFRQEARQVVAQCVNARVGYSDKHSDVVIFAGSGSTGAVDRLARVDRPRRCCRSRRR